MSNTTQPHALIADDAVITLVSQPRRQRVWEIDFLRGICVILMVLDHLSMLVALYFGKAWYGSHFYALGAGDAFTRFCYAWQMSDARDVIHAIVLFVFFAISGISSTFSHSNAKRGLQLLIVALVYSLCSYLAEVLFGLSNVLVLFGVLNFLAVCILLYALINRLCRENPLAISLVSLALIIVCVCLYFCYTPPQNTPKIFAIVFPPHDFYGNPSLFYSQSEFSPGDLFTLLPWMPFFFSGIIIANIFYPVRMSLLPCLDHSWHKPVCFIGRHALIVYVAHILVLAGVLALISYLFITPGSWGI